MFFIFLLLSLLWLYIVFLLSHDIFHPAFITLLVWIFVPCVYNFLILKTKLWHYLSDDFYLLMTLYVTVFTIVSLYISKKKINFSNSVFNLGSKYIILQKICFFSILFVDFYFFNLVRSVGYSLIRDELTDLPFFAKLGTYALPLELVLFCYGFMKKKEKILSFFYYSSFILALVQIFLMASKGGYFQILICLIFLLSEHKKLSTRAISIIILIFIVLVSVLQLARGSGNDRLEQDFITRFLYIYFLSPMPALDLVIKGNVNLSYNMFGSRTFQFLYRFLNKTTGVPLPITISGSSGWVQVPYLTNVYTMLGNFYIDFGFIGMVIAGFVYGIIFGGAYSFIRNQKSMSHQIFYALFLYCIVFQFFGDWLLSFFSATLQSIFWIFLITHRFKTYSLRYRR